MVNEIVRQLNIDLITDTPNPIIDWFNDLWSKMHLIETNVFHCNGGEFIYYIINEDKKEWIFYQDNDNGLFWCTYGHYWSYFYSEFNVNYTDIQNITKILVENALNNSIATPGRLRKDESQPVENALNNSIATPSLRVRNGSVKVVNALSDSVSTPTVPFIAKAYGVVNALNNSIATPNYITIIPSQLIEYALINKNDK